MQASSIEHEGTEKRLGVDASVKGRRRLRSKKSREEKEEEGLRSS